MSECEEVNEGVGLVLTAKVYISVLQIQSQTLWQQQVLALTNTFVLCFSLVQLISLEIPS